MHSIDDKPARSVGYLTKSALLHLCANPPKRNSTCTIGMQFRSPKAHFNNIMSIYDNRSETPGKRAVSVIRCIIAVLDLTNAILLGITLALYYAWMPKETGGRIPIDWTDPLVIIAVRTRALIPSSPLLLSRLCPQPCLHSY